ncbi:glycosyltransferase [Rhodococcus sp. 14-1411-2a]|uniref:glycosyltransferase n=1 Tax=Rhodococcus sp. 14-1411-2a TaxID=2023151 RepID=UPI000B9BDF40|nr:hypothetical protein CH291_06905 [Rhodococcus sp. 14-1411-2a]
MINADISAQGDLLAISFATRPSQGSEGGVGWTFVRAAGQLAESTGTHVDLICDGRDEIELRAAMEFESWSNSMTVHPVALPSAALAKFGNARTRLSYLAWMPKARLLANRLVANSRYRASHQFTFATASMPSCLPTKAAMRVWGPLAIPDISTSSELSKCNFRDRIGVKAGQYGSRTFISSVSRLICQNDNTLLVARTRGVPATLEPNVVAEPRVRAVSTDQILTLAGSLIERKRPWLALQMINDAKMKDFRLQIVGDGPLRPEMERYCRLERISSRVEFTGHISHADAVERISISAALVHFAVREGAGWVVGEAAAGGVPSVVLGATGAATVLRLSGDLGVNVAECDSAAPPLDQVREAVLHTVERDNWLPSSRWSAKRLPELVGQWTSSPEPRSGFDERA